MATTRTNRCLTSEELRSLQAHIHQDDELLSIMQARLTSRLEVKAAAEIAVQSATAALQEAELRLSGARRRYTSVLDGLELIKSAVADEDGPSGPGPLQESTHLLALNQAQRNHLGLILTMEESLRAAEKEVYEASKAASACKADVEHAHTLRDFSEGDVKSLERYIEEIQDTITKKRTALRPIFRIPNEILGEIFSLAASDPILEPHRIQILVICNVCVRWRKVILSHPELRLQVLWEGWNSIESLTVARLDKPFILYVLPLLRNIKLIELHGEVAVPFLSFLLEETSILDLDQQQRTDSSPDIWHFPQLSVQDYIGDGDILVRFADKIHAKRYTLSTGDAVAVWPSENYPENHARTSRVFLSWYFRNHGLGVPAVKQRVQGRQRTYIIEAAEKRIATVMTNTEWGLLSACVKQCFKEGARKLLTGDRYLRYRYADDARVGRHGTERLFKIELRNCRISNAANRQNLELYS